MRISLLILTICLMAPSIFGVDKVLKSVPLRTSLVAKFDLDSIKEIAFVKSLLDDTSNIKVSEFRSAIQSYAGLDVMKVKELWVIAGAQDEYIFIARGGFDTLPVEKALRKLNKYGDLKVDGVHFAGLFDDDNNPGKKNLIAILNDSTVILSQPKFGKEYLEIFTGKKSGLGAKELRNVEKVEKSKYLMHAKSINLFIPPAERQNPILGNLAAGEMFVKKSSKYLTARVETEAKDKNNIAGLTFLLNGIINNAKRENKPDQNPVVKEGLQNAKVTNNSNGITVETKFSLRTLELIAEDQLNGLEAIFE